MRIAPKSEVRLPLSKELAVLRQREETLILDDRAALRPSEIVEQRLLATLKSGSVMVSQMQKQLKPSGR